jgi:hypothetical protein
MIGLTSARLASRLAAFEALLPSVYLLSAILVAEFVSYWLQRLLRNDCVKWPAKVHLIHYFEAYSPDSVLRSRDVPLLKPWFGKARRLHDIFHHSIDNDVSMNAHFGIGFFPLACVFCTIHKLHRPYKQHGSSAAKKRLVRHELINDDTQFPSHFRL